MTPPFVLLEKKLGQTPLQALEAWKASNPLYKDVPATYAGRLDPMAEGKLLVLLGEECKRQEKYRGLDKEYEIEVLLDLGTDTGDVLGMPESRDAETHPKEEEFRAVFREQTGAKTVPYPAFSSKTANGVPLFQYALEGTLDTISIPTHEETIYRIELLSQDTVLGTALKERIMEILSYAPRAPEASKALGADFRQDAIRAAWESLFENVPSREFSVLRLRVTCASGSYMRTLAERIAEVLGTEGMALSIRRTRIGMFVPFLSRGFWRKLYR